MYLIYFKMFDSDKLHDLSCIGIPTLDNMEEAKDFIVFRNLALVSGPAYDLLNINGFINKDRTINDRAVITTNKFNIVIIISN